MPAKAEFNVYNGSVLFRSLIEKDKAKIVVLNDNTIVLALLWGFLIILNQSLCIFVMNINYVEALLAIVEDFPLFQLLLAVLFIY